MTRYVLSGPAASDLHDIDTYIAKINPAAAERTVDDLERTMRLISEMPGIGHVRPELAGGAYRFFPVGSYLIVYLPGASPLSIVRVLHQARDITQHFKQAA
jgi:toxin ParE1/3/4